MYALSSEESVSDLRYNVTSPGGTTASALYELEKGGYRTVVADAGTSLAAAVMDVAVVDVAVVAESWRGWANWR